MLIEPDKRDPKYAMPLSCAEKRPFLCLENLGDWNNEHGGLILSLVDCFAKKVLFGNGTKLRIAGL